MLQTSPVQLDQSALLTCRLGSTSMNAPVTAFDLLEAALAAEFNLFPFPNQG